MSTSSMLAIGDVNPTTGKKFTTDEYINWLQAILKAKDEELAAKNNRAITFKVAWKSGAISVYGLNNRMPVTLYSQQVPRLYEALTGKPMADDSPIAVFLKKAEPFANLKEDSDQVKTNKLALRQADTSGICSQEKETEAA